MPSALDLVDEAIADLQARLNLDPSSNNASTTGKTNINNNATKKQQTKKEKKPKQPPQAAAGAAAASAAADDDDNNLPEICRLEFKVGVITKAWVHETADKLYCEEIDVGEPEGPRQIASGLRAHIPLEQMQGQRLLVVANLKPKNLLGFKSHGMVLCAAQKKDDGSELVEFVEPPVDAVIGEVVTFDGLPTPAPLSATQVEKKKVFQKCGEGMKTNDECVATWNGHVFLTSAGPCKAKTIAGGQMR